MGTIELILISIGLSMDAFAVAVCKGLSMRKVSLKNALIVALWFGFFQAFMPILGYFLGRSFEKYISSFDHFIAFFLLSFIGVNMIIDSFSKVENETDESLKFSVMLLMAVATSIDALAVGITFAFFIEGIKHLSLAVLLIGIITFLLSFFGVKIGSIFGRNCKAKASRAGGCILILLGTKILLEHLGVIPF